MDTSSILARNRAISAALSSTRNRRKSQICKTYKIKVDTSALTAQQWEQLTRMFLEAKWLYNDILNWSNLSEDNSPFNYTIGNTVYVRMPNGELQPRQLTTIPVHMRQGVQKQICGNIKMLARLKQNGKQHPGALKFKSEVNVLHMHQLRGNFIRKNKHAVKIPNVTGSVRVTGLDQIPLGVEYACAQLINSPKGYYLHIVTYTDKSKYTPKSPQKDILGIDFGCHTNFTLSTGEKINCIVEESERLKRLQRKLSRQVKGSNSYKRTVHLIRIEYQKMTNRKDDLANKLVNKFNNYQQIVIQDEQLRLWKVGGHGKVVYHSVLGRVKSKLVRQDNVTILDRWFPTTKLCTNCGVVHSNMSVRERIFSCSCGVSEDRDVHSAKTMIWLYQHVGAGCTDIKRVELKSLPDELTYLANFNCEA